MVTKYNFRYTLTLLYHFFTLVTAHYSPSFGFNKFDKNSKSFWSQIMLLGDATLVDNSSFVQLTASWNYSSGSVMFRQPIHFSDSNSRRIGRVSFGTYFVFSLSLSVLPENGSGLAFVLHRNGSADPGFGINVSDVKMRLNGGEKLQCWIDFETTSNRIEVRVSKLGEERPISPLISRQIDLSSLFENEDVYIGLSSSNTNTTQICKLYSWSFKLRQVPIWMHSQPLDPQGFKKDAEPVDDAEPVVMHKRSDCILRVITALVFGTGCGALGAFIVLCVCSVLVTKKPAAVAPEEYVVQPVVFDCDKVKVIVIDKSDNGKK